MSKKLIAVAAATALALTGLIAPAYSAGSALTLTVNNEIAGGGASSTDAFTIPVPSADVLRNTDTANRSVVEVVVATIENNATVTVATSGAVKLLTATQVAASTTTTATGTATLSLTADSSGATKFYAYNTSTSAVSITVQEVKAGAVIGASTVWLKGVTYAENAYKINAVAPTTVGIGSAVDFTATVVDMFGNAIENGHTIDVVSLGGNATDPGNMVWNATKKIYEGTFTSRTTAGTMALSVPIATLVQATAVTAFGAKSTSAFFSITATDLQASVTALQAQVTALTAQITALTDEYNKLATRFNKRVTLKKAPTKKVVLK